MKKMLGLMTMLAAVVLMASVSFGQSISTTDYALNTTAPSNYGTYSMPTLTSNWYQAVDLDKRTMLTDGNINFTWSDVDGWSGDATTPPFFIVINLGSVKNDINAVAAVNVDNYGSAITYCTTIRVYGSTSYSTSSMTYWGNMVDLLGTDTSSTSWGAYPWSFNTTANLSAQYIYINPWFQNDSWHKLFTEVAVMNIKDLSAVKEWALY
jgi:hypothetical protein